MRGKNDLRKDKKRKKKSFLSYIWIEREKENHCHFPFLAFLCKFCCKIICEGIFIGSHIIEICFLSQYIFFQFKHTNFPKIIIFFLSKFVNPNKPWYFIKTIGWCSCWKFLKNFLFKLYSFFATSFSYNLIITSLVLIKYLSK